MASSDLSNHVCRYTLLGFNKQLPEELVDREQRLLSRGWSILVGMVDQHKFFRRLGKRVRQLRLDHDYSQEDMISFGFSARHWQQIEAGRPITVSTLLRICEAFKISVERLVRGLDKETYRQ